MPAERVREHVALVNQEHHVFVGSLRDNLLLARAGAGDGELWAALHAVGADAWARALPDGLDTEVGSGGRALTPAQAQQVALARLVLADPHTLVLDEATSLLDPRAARHLERSLARVLEGRTVVAIAHRLHTAHDADLIAVVDGGRITEWGGHDELVAADGAYAALWRSGTAPRTAAEHRARVGRGRGRAGSRSGRIGSGRSRRRYGRTLRATAPPRPPRTMKSGMRTRTSTQAPALKRSAWAARSGATACRRSGSATGPGSPRRSARRRCRGRGRPARSAGQSHRYSCPGASNSQAEPLPGWSGNPPGSTRWSRREPHEDVAGDPGGFPQQALHREHEVDEEDREHRPPAAGDGERRGPGADGDGPDQVWVSVRWPPLLRGSLAVRVAL